MIAYDNNRALISLHVPKTAGTSFANELRSWFGEANVHLHYRTDAGVMPVAVPMRAGLCVHGHFNALRGLGVAEYYPSADQFIMFLRDPFERFISQWRFIHQRYAEGLPLGGGGAPNASVEAWIHERAVAFNEGRDGYSFLAHFPKPVDPANAAGIFDMPFVSIGIVEEYEVSLKAMAERLGFAVPPSLARVNVGVGPRGDYGHLRPLHERLFAFEHEIYALVAARVTAA